MEPSRPQRALDFGELRVDARGLGSLWPVANQLDIHTFAHKVWRTSALSQDAEETVTTKKETPKLNPKLERLTDSAGGLRQEQTL